MDKYLLFALTVLVLAIGTRAEHVVSFYGGWQGALKSNVSGTDHLGQPFDFTAQWEGKSFSTPIYYGIRYTYWFKNDAGVSLDFSHSKVYAEQETLDTSGFEVLELTDGLNTLTLNYMKRYPEVLYSLTPYWGAGAGVAIPHVEVQTAPGAPKTFEFQLGGYALQGQLGLEKALSERWALFLEYKLNYTGIRVDLDGGGKLETDIIVNALNAGINFSF